MKGKENSIGIIIFDSPSFEINSKIYKIDEFKYF